MDKDVLLFALSTCIHCKNTKQFLDDCGVKHQCVFVDTLTGDERKAVVQKVKEYNAACSFPTLVINDGERVIVGFKRDEIKEVLGL